MHQVVAVSPKAGEWFVLMKDKLLTYSLKQEQDGLFTLKVLCYITCQKFASKYNFP